MELHLKKSDLVTFSLIAAIWLYSNLYVFVTFYNNEDVAPRKTHERLFIDNIDDSKFLINTQGCFIPNYSKRMKFLEARNLYRSCGQRAVFIKKITDTKIAFKIDRSKLKIKYHADKTTCCYQYINRDKSSGKEDDFITYTKCLPFRNGTTASLKGDFIYVLCKNHNNVTIYTDAYMLIKKVVKKNMTPKNEHAWNVLMLGLDTMSRTRLYNSMPETAKYFKRMDWLDYRGYHKVASNTFPNLIASLTGKTLKTINKACSKGMTCCNDLFMWSKFSKSGYVTAYAEDFLKLPDTFTKFNGYQKPPTNHYARPFFLTGEKERGNLMCTKTMPSAYHILNYVLDFAKVYKEEKHFGFFWINSYTHNEINLPTLLDRQMVYFFEKLNSIGSLENTFIFFFSDHGIRFGATRDFVEAYYEERLPMLFIWVPRQYKEKNYEHYYNLITNQIKLTTPYDLHETLWNILQISDKSIKVPKGEACPNCTSLFNYITDKRTCADVSITNKWCGCHGLVNISKNNKRTEQIINLAAFELQNKTKYAKTTKCTICRPLKLNKVLRLHEYIDVNATYYIIAFSMKPANLKFEVNLKEDASGQIEVIKPTYTISRYNSKGYCVKNPYDRDFCVCKKVC